MDNLLAELRKATRPIHDQLDSSPQSASIADQDLTASAYAQLIAWQYRSHLIVESGLAAFNWPFDFTYQNRLPALMSEVKDSASPNVENLKFSAPTTLGQATGRAYVLLGSALGGNMILGHLKANKALATLAPFSFYQFQRDHGLQQWRDFSAFAKTHPFTAVEIQDAVQEAVRVFEVFAAK